MSAALPAQHGDAADASSVVLEMANVRFRWPGRDGFSLAIDRFAVRGGEKLLLQGPSGAGKSTLLSLICGVVHPQNGSIEVAGTDIAGLNGAACDRFRADHFGIVFQMFNLLPYGTILDNVLLPLSFSRARRHRALTRGTAASEARRLLTRLGLEEDLHHRKAAALSTGQQQRVAVARALIGNPDIVIADEPTSALDSDRRADFLTLLGEEVGRAGATLIMVSHDRSLASHFDRAVPMETVLQRPAHDA